MTDIKTAISNPKWNENVQEFLKQESLIDSLDKECQLMARWVLELYKFDPKCTANAFVFQLLSSSQHVIALASLGLFTPAAGSLRGMVESALYFVYFRTHPTELSTLLRDKDFYVQKSDVLQYLNQHIPDYSIKQSALSLNADLNSWYKEVSSVIHAQIPGNWGGPKDLSSTKFNESHVKNVTSMHGKAASLINRLLLCTVAPDIWGQSSPENRKLFLKSLPAATKQILKLDSLGVIQ